VRYDVNYINFCCILDYLRHCASNIKAEFYPEEGSSMFLRKAEFHVPNPKYVVITYKTTALILIDVKITNLCKLILFSVLIL